MSRLSFQGTEQVGRFPLVFSSSGARHSDGLAQIQRSTDGMNGKATPDISHCKSLDHSEHGEHHTRHVRKCGTCRRLVSRFFVS
jgi:hypothetical protein